MGKQPSPQWRSDRRIKKIRWRFQGKRWWAYGDFREYADVGGTLEALHTTDKAEAENRYYARHSSTTRNAALAI